MDKQLIYLDNCCFNRPYDDQSQTSVSLEAQAKLQIQEMIKEGGLLLANSSILWYELSQNPFAMRKKAIGQFLETYASVFVRIDEKGVKELADSIMERGIKPKDAYHIASACAASCSALVTTDQRMLKFQSNAIRIINPIDFLREVEGENDTE